MLRLYTVPASTNVERVALALAHKGLPFEYVPVPYDDRGEVRRVSGQDLVPVLLDGERAVHDSMEIVRYLEERYPERPRLYPADPARRAECLIFIDWFNRVWKRPPNEMTEELQKPTGEIDRERVARLGAALQGYLDLFEQMLTGREYLMGEYSAADVAAFPFLKYATLHPENDPYLFHKVLMDSMKPGRDHPQLQAWIARVDRRSVPETRVHSGE
ncbi:MAG TPA: glutathione S-transferase family protein [Candidatus Polarisedimenticolia bacterium]|nr:glutathione S-transferase family protein [Candidatus Polarisedimenticolia bacterium]